MCHRMRGLRALTLSWNRSAPGRTASWKQDNRKKRVESVTYVRIRGDAPVIRPGAPVRSTICMTCANAFAPLRCSGAARKWLQAVRPGKASASSLFGKRCEGCGRSVNGHCRHCDLGASASANTTIFLPQREWSLPTLRHAPDHFLLPPFLADGTAA